MLELQKISDFQAANFQANTKEDTLQVKLVIKLLTDSIKTNTIITLDDIKDIHAEYVMASKRNGTGYGWFIDDDGKKSWRRAKSKEEWKSSHCYDSLSLTWFKNNLGQAILKGRLLAIPVIQL
jgi:hypothetical protein